MSVEKIREVFEAWAVKRKGPKPWELPHFICFKNEDGTYVDNGANVAWEAWQASRESLVIELPRCYCADPEALDYVDNVLEVIEAAGLKVKS